MNLISKCFFILSVLLCYQNISGKDYLFEDKSGTKISSSITVFNQDSIRLNLKKMIDVPTLLTFTYYECQNKCTKLMPGILELIERTNYKIGQQFQVITIGIDTSETVFNARKKKSALLKDVQIANIEENWQFCVTDSRNLDSIADITGYHYEQYSTGIKHPLVSILLTPDGKISQYFYGTFFMPVHFELAVMDAWKEKTMPARIKNLKFCSNVIPEENKIVRYISITSGILFIFVALGLFLILLLKRR